MAPPCEKQPRTPGLFSLEKGRLRGDLTAVPHERQRTGRHWSLLCYRTQRDGIRLCQGRFSLNIRKVFHQRVVGQWNSLPKDSVQEAFGQCSQAHGVILGAVLCRARSWTFDSCGSLRRFYDYPRKVQYSQENWMKNISLPSCPAVQQLNLSFLRHSKADSPFLAWCRI